MYFMKNNYKKNRLFNYKNMIMKNWIRKMDKLLFKNNKTSFFHLIHFS